MKEYTVLDMYEELQRYGSLGKPRGQLCKEVEYFQGVIMDPWSVYVGRNYSLDYFKREFQWYLGADPYDQRICKYATMWDKIKQKDGRIYSNYGHYWFGAQNGFGWCSRILQEDPDSRQAYIPMCNYHHMKPNNRDVVCTKGIQFRIHKDALNIHVTMRSSDIVYGVGTDLPCFWYLWLMMCSELYIEPGKFIFSTDSLHVYEKHFQMVDTICDAKTRYAAHTVPEIDDVDDLIFEAYESDFGKWLTEVEL